MNRSKYKNKCVNKYIKKFISLTVVLVMTVSIAVGMTACAVKPKDSGKLSIVTTLFPQYDFAKQIAGDKAEVTLLLSPGIEAHSYDPTPSDIVSINESDLFIYTGEYMETWAAKVIKSLEKDVTILDVSEGLELTRTEDESSDIENEDNSETYTDEAQGNEQTESTAENVGLTDDGQNKADGDIEENEHDEHEGHNHVYDPHIWTSPVMAKQMVENILDGLIKADPENEEYYRTNAENYLAQLSELDGQFREVTANADIKTVYFADKFAMYYFVKEYGLSYVSAYDSCSSETEPSAKLVAKMVDEVKKNNAPAIFYAELSNHKAADTISKETGTKKLLLHSCHNVSKEEFNKGVTYISLMKQNLENLKVGLYKEKKETA